MFFPGPFVSLMSILLGSDGQAVESGDSLDQSVVGADLSFLVTWQQCGVFEGLGCQRGVF